MIVGVMASGKEPFPNKHRDLAETVGSAIAEHGFDLLTGGGGGLMAIVGLAFPSKKKELLKANKAAGNLISILRAQELPPFENGIRRRLPNADNKLGEIVIRTHLPYSGEHGLDPLSHNHINALTSDLIVILPGGSGTLSELQLGWEYDKDIMIYLGEAEKVDGHRPSN